MPSMSLFRPYYYGKQRYEDYLLDVTDAIESNTTLQRQGNKLQKRAAEEMQAQQYQSLQQQEAMREELGALSDGIDGLREDLRLGVSLIVDRMGEEIALFSKAVTHLEGIRDILKAPRATAATELFEKGEYCFRQKFYDEALDKFLMAEQIDKVNYLLQYRIGSLYLEGLSRTRRVVDFGLAEAHLLLSVRYAEPTVEQDPAARRFAGDAYFRAGKAAYHSGEQRLGLGDTQGMKDCLGRAVQYFNSSTQLWPENTASIYWKAKCHALLGERDRALHEFEILSDRDRSYLAIAMEDGDFAGLRDSVDLVFKRALESPGPNAISAASKVNAASELLTWAKSLSNLSNSTAIGRMEQFLSTAGKRLRGNDINFDVFLPQIDKFRSEMVATFENELAAKKAELDGIVRSRTAERAGPDTTIARAKQQMSETKGSGGIGCLFAILTFVGLEIAIPLMIRPWARELSGIRSNGLNVLTLFLIGFVICLGYLFGTMVSRNSRRQPFRRQVDAALRSIEEWERVVSPIVEGAKSDSRTIDRELEELHSRTHHAMLAPKPAGYRSAGAQ